MFGYLARVSVGSSVTFFPGSLLNVNVGKKFFDHSFFLAPLPVVSSIVNFDLWQSLLSIVRRRSVSIGFSWTKGHAKIADIDKFGLTVAQVISVTFVPMG